MESRIILLTLICLTSLTAGHAEELILQNGLNGFQGASDAALIGVNDRAKPLNYGGEEILEVAGVPTGGLRKLGLIQFQDLVGPNRIPAKRVIQSAYLEIHKIRNVGTEETFAKVKPNQLFIFAYPMRSGWTAGNGRGNLVENGASFSYRALQAEFPQFWGAANQIEEGPVRDADYNSQEPISAPFKPEEEGTWMRWDVTPIVQHWIDNPPSNFGLLLMARSYYIGAEFASCETPTVEERPKLIITY